MQRNTPEGATGHATDPQPASLKAAAQRVLQRNSECNEPATDTPQRVQREGGWEGVPVARDQALQQAARAADLHPETLEATLSPEDRADLADGLMTPDELTAYAESVAARWRDGWVLDDERDLATAERVRRDPLDGLPLIREDKMFVARCTVGRTDQHDLLTEYRARWLAAAEAEGNEIRRDNAGRRAANAWLRQTTERT